MGAEALWIPLVASVVAGGAQYMDARQQRKKANTIALQSLQSNSKRQQQADARTAQLLDETSKSTPAAERSSLLSGFLSQLVQARPDAQAGIAAGGGGDAYARDAASAALGIDQKGREFADLASRLDAPRYQRIREGRNRADAGIDLSLIGGQQRDADRLTQTRMGGVQSSPWLQALAAVAGGVAKGYSGGTASAAASSEPVGFGNNMDEFMRVGWGR